MKTFHFNFDTDILSQLRGAVNEKQNLSLKKEDVLKNSGETYFAWDRICAIMDRLDDTINHINSLELGGKESRSAFDFYEFISCAAVVIDCIRYIGRVFGVDASLVKLIENTQDVFGSEYSDSGTDRQFFEYVRSLCVTHPTRTDHQPAYLDGAQFHCCPFVLWSHQFWGSQKEGDLNATVYTSKPNSGYGLHLPLYVEQFERYLGKWLNHIRDIIDAIRNYNESVYEKLRNEHVKTLDEFSNTIEYLRYLKGEYCRRFGDDDSYIFDRYIRIFQISLTNPNNQILLEKYKCAVIYALGFLRNSMQNMCHTGIENTGIEHEDPSLETSLFIELLYVNNYNSAFSRFSYNLQKSYYLEPENQYSYYDKLYARKLLEEVKEAINGFVVFNNNESDEETVILIALAKYLNALNSKNILNKNIPNKDKFRAKLLSRQELDELFAEAPTEDKDVADLSKLDKILNTYMQ